MSSDSELHNSPHSGGGHAPEPDEGGGNPAPEDDEGGSDHVLEKQPSPYNRKKALLIAISYQKDPIHELTTLKDVEIFKKFLIECRDYNENEITVLSDADDTHENLKPYTQNIVGL
ncbi:hypothetical protein DXG01_010018 [Tephrocybe rancida]|nr:hypothetical protein DXG01_010018 [Tephrocybe rancida]